jgi:hypothetical protein
MQDFTQVASNVIANLTPNIIDLSVGAYRLYQSGAIGYISAQFINGMALIGEVTVVTVRTARNFNRDAIIRNVIELAAQYPEGTEIIVNPVAENEVAFTVQRYIEGGNLR